MSPLWKALRIRTWNDPFKILYPCAANSIWFIFELSTYTVLYAHKMKNVRSLFLCLTLADLRQPCKYTQMRSFSYFICVRLKIIMNYIEFPLKICIICQTFTLNQSIFSFKKRHLMVDRPPVPQTAFLSLVDWTDTYVDWSFCGHSISFHTRQLLIRCFFI